MDRKWVERMLAVRCSPGRKSPPQMDGCGSTVPGNVQTRLASGVTTNCAVLSRYSGREIALASLHRKERILLRPLRAGLGLTLRHASGVDTDRFGSFGGEQVRRDDARTTCLRKAEAALVW